MEGKESMTRATSDGVSDSRQPSRRRVCSRDGVQVGFGVAWLDAEINARPILVAKSVTVLMTGSEKSYETAKDMGANAIWEKDD